MITTLLSVALAWMPVAYAEPAASAAGDAKPIYDLSLEELLQVSIASKRPELARETPGIVTVVTEQEIRNSGARSLVDIFQLVPGYQVAADYQGTLSLGVRGLWAIEGKVLLMLDGVEMNDLYYNAMLLTYSFPVDQIKRIEIVRGPGSVIYGGAAEYGVINIITHTGEEQKGARATARFGQMENANGHLNLSVSAGNKYGDKPGDLDVSLKGFVGQANATDRDRTYPDGNRISAAGDYLQTPVSLNFRAKYQGFTAQFLMDRVGQKARDMFGTAFLKPTDMRFDTYAAAFSYEWAPMKDLIVTPQYTLRYGRSYFNDDLGLQAIDGSPATAGTNFDIFVLRNRISVPARYQAHENLSLLVGAEAFVDRGFADGVSSFSPNPADPSIKEKTGTFSDQAIYAQAAWTTLVGTLTGGARYEHHSVSGNSLVPRIGWTKTLDALHFKALYSRAFRNPSVGNINDAAGTGVRVKPEKTRALELEAGYRVDSQNTVTLNAFETVVSGPIVYEASNFSYANGGQTGTRGIDLDYRNRSSWGYSGLTFSYYSAANLNSADKFIVPQDSNALAGFANYKVTWNLSYKLTEKAQLSPTLIYLGKRYGFQGDVDADGALEVRQFDPSITANLFFSYDDLVVKGLQLGLGVANIFNTRADSLAPYDLGRDSLPNPTREYLLRVGYQLGF